jgi:hypothetical protein
MSQIENNQIEMVIKHCGLFNIFAHFFSIFIILGMIFAFVIEDEWHWLEWIILFFSILLFFNTKNLRIYTVFNRERKTIISKRFTLLGIFSSKMNFPDVKRIRIGRLYWGRFYQKTAREDLWLCMEDDQEVLIINSKKFPPGVSVDEITIRNFIGLLEDAPDTERRPQTKCP